MIFYKAFFLDLFYSENVTFNWRGVSDAPVVKSPVFLFSSDDVFLTHRTAAGDLIELEIDVKYFLDYYFTIRDSKSQKLRTLRIGRATGNASYRLSLTST